jgi:hypothetical protein
MSSAAFKPRADLVPSSALDQNFRTEDLPLAADHVNYEIPPETGQRKYPGSTALSSRSTTNVRGIRLGRPRKRREKL